MRVIDLSACAEFSQRMEQMMMIQAGPALDSSGERWGEEVLGSEFAEGSWQGGVTQLWGAGSQLQIEHNMQQPAFEFRLWYKAVSILDMFSELNSP